MLEWIKIIQRSQVKDRLPGEKAALLSGGAYGHIEDYVTIYGTDSKEMFKLQHTLSQEGFNIKGSVLKGLIEEEFKMNPTIQKEAIRRGGAYHVIEKYAKKFGDDLREMARLKSVLLEYGFRVEEFVIEKLIEEEHRLYLKIKAVVNPRKDRGD